MSAGAQLAGSPSVAVSQFVSMARQALERALPTMWIGGEISGFLRAASGHCYFTLKDERAQVRCVLWRGKAQLLDLKLADGMAVDVRATPTLYEARGEFQLVVDWVRPAGAGALYERFAKLKAKLEAAGWFDPARKRPLPAWPRAVGVVTSAQGAALHDILTILARRWPSLRVVVYPSPVQGEGAAARIAAAIAVANARAEVDVLIVGRGGGSIEDLWAFNEEAVARAILDSALPVVSAVGHETDFTIADFVADLRAPTPTAAAALVAPDGEAIASRVAVLAGRLARAAQNAQATRGQRLDLAARGLVHPRARLDAQRAQLGQLATRAAAALRLAAERATGRLAATEARFARELARPLPATAIIERLGQRWRVAARAGTQAASARVDLAARALAHLDPSAVLERGYAIVTAADGRIVLDAATLARGDTLAIALARGRAEATVERTDGDTAE